MFCFQRTHLQGTMPSPSGTTPDILAVFIKPLTNGEGRSDWPNTDAFRWSAPLCKIQCHRYTQQDIQYGFSVSCIVLSLRHRHNPKGSIRYCKSFFFLQNGIKKDQITQTEPCSPKKQNQRKPDKVVINKVNATKNVGEGTLKTVRNGEKAQQNERSRVTPPTSKNPTNRQRYSINIFHNKTLWGCIKTFC